MADKPALYATCDPTATKAALAAVAPAADQSTDAVSHDSAERVAADAGRRVARRTGATARSVAVYKVHRGDGKGYVVVVREAGLYLEYGTRRMRAEAFLVPAERLESPGFQRRQRDAVQDAIDHVGLGPTGA